MIFSAQYKAESLEPDRGVRHDGQSRTKDSHPDYFDLDIVGESYYVQGIYRIDPHWEMVVRYDVLYSRMSTIATEPSPRPLLGITLALPVCQRLDCRRPLQHHSLVDGTGRVPQCLRRDVVLFPQDNPDVFALDKKWDIFALLLSYRF